jgi:hypothetical protein
MALKPWREGELRLWLRLVWLTALALAAFVAALYLVWGNG